MLAMQYKGFVWPNNPSDCRLELRRDVARHSYPGSSYQLEDLGESRRVFSGQGEFYGELAYLHMAQLARVYEQSGPGVLIHPVMELQRALFTELTLLEEPRENYVAYQFTFEEDGKDAVQAQKIWTGFTYTVKAGDNLWMIASLYDTNVPTLLALNSWISNPNRLEEGKRVVLP